MTHPVMLSAPSSRHAQVATDALVAMERAMARDKIATNDRQLACARIASEEGRNYLKVGARVASLCPADRRSTRGPLAEDGSATTTNVTFGSSSWSSMIAAERMCRCSGAGDSLLGQLFVVQRAAAQHSCPLALACLMLWSVLTD